MVPTLKISNENRVSVVQDNQETKSRQSPIRLQRLEGIVGRSFVRRAWTCGRECCGIVNDATAVQQNESICAEKKPN